MSEFPTSEAIIRPFRPRDFPAISALNRSTFAEHATREAGFDDDGPVKRLNRLGSVRGRLVNALSRGPLRALVAEAEGAFAGYVVSMHARPHTCIFFDIGVVPELRRSGLGRQLFVAAQSEALRLEYSKFIATAWPNNRASIALLEEFGYARDHAAEPHGSDGPYTFVRYPHGAPGR